MIRRLAARAGWWGVVAAGVVWGLLCVGVRHVALRAGLQMEDLVAERQQAVQRVQVLERAAGRARRLDRVEELAGAAGLRKPGPGQLVIAPPEAPAPTWTAWWGGGKPAAAAGGPPPEALRIRPREEVVVGPPVKRAAPARRGAARGRAGRKHR